MEQDPYAAFDFRLELDGVPIAGFAKCTGLTAQTVLETYREGGRNGAPLIFPSGGTVGNVTLERGMTRSDHLVEWQLDAIALRPARKDIAIVLESAGPKRQSVKRWELSRALPVRWQGPELVAASSAIAIEVLELAHEGLRCLPVGGAARPRLANGGTA